MLRYSHYWVQLTIAIATVRLISIGDSFYSSFDSFYSFTFHAGKSLLNSPEKIHIVSLIQEIFPKWKSIDEIKLCSIWLMLCSSSFIRVWASVLVWYAVWSRRWNSGSYALERMGTSENSRWRRDGEAHMHMKLKANDDEIGRPSRNSLSAHVGL